MATMTLDVDRYGTATAKKEKAPQKDQKKEVVVKPGRSANRYSAFLRRQRALARLMADKERIQKLGDKKLASTLLARIDREVNALETRLLAFNPKHTPG